MPARRGRALAQPRPGQGQGAARRRPRRARRDDPRGRRAGRTRERRLVARARAQAGSAAVCGDRGGRAYRRAGAGARGRRSGRSARWRSRRRPRRRRRRRPAPAARRSTASRLPATRVIRSEATSAETIRSRSGSCVRRGRQRHRRRRELALPHQRRRPSSSPSMAGQDRVADPRVVEVVAAQVGDAGDHPALDQRQAGDVGGDGHGGGDQAAEVGERSPGRRRSGRGSRSPRGSALSTSPRCSSQLLVGGRRGAGGSGPTPWMARCRASRTNAVVRPGASSVIRGASRFADAACRAHAASLRVPPAPRPSVEPCTTVAAVPRRAPPRLRGPSPTPGFDADRRPGRDRRRPRAGHRCSAAYRRGLFPMPSSDRRATRCAGSRPVRRGVLPLDGLRVSRSLRRSCRRLRDPRRHGVRRGGRRRAPTRARPSRLDRRATSARRTCGCTRLGWAHSVEAWRDGRLAGGLYGVAIGGLFAGESMFHRETDASKVALVGLVGPAARRARRAAACSTCSGRRRTWPPSASSRSRGRRTCAGCPTPSRCRRRPPSAAPRCGVERRMGHGGRPTPPIARSPPMKHALIAASLRPGRRNRRRVRRRRLVERRLSSSPPAPPTDATTSTSATPSSPSAGRRQARRQRQGRRRRQGAQEGRRPSSPRSAPRRTPRPTPAEGFDITGRADRGHRRQRHQGRDRQVDDKTLARPRSRRRTRFSAYVSATCKL